GYRGKAPDLGAYEFGGPRWVAGADWRDPDMAMPPARNLAYAPRKPVTAETMIMDGLVLWFDATDKASLEFGTDGNVRAWRDKSSHRRVARVAQPNGVVKWIAQGMNGRAVLWGNGTGSLRVADLKREPGPVVVFVVSQALAARGPSWQRIIASFNGAGQEWVTPNWMIGAPGGAKTATWEAQVFTIQERNRAALGTITVLGASASQGQALGGDIGEVLVFGRTLRFDEMEAVQKYLAAKWGIAE
ncbi:MAG: hypothetical protein HN904_22150, partial [Victivallales bacterium]|nr:hypothetical protein [Victivallales bacterium]